MGLFEQMPGCAWRAHGGQSVRLPAKRVSESVDKRVIARKRPYRKGAKLDTTSRDYLIWEIECIFHNDGDEPGVPAQGNYPDELNRLCASIDVDETGTLTLPTRGEVRAQFKGYRRVEDQEMRDVGVVTLTFWEDNEDGVSQAAFGAPSARAAATLLAFGALDEAQKSGTWGDLVSSVATLASKLEAIANFPGDYVDDVEATANSLISRVGQVESAFADAKNRAERDTATLLLHPEASPAGRALRRVAGVAQRARRDAGIGDRTKTVRYLRAVSIFDVASEQQQDAIALMRLNPRFGDYFAIPAGTPIRIYSTPASFAA